MTDPGSLTREESESQGDGDMDTAALAREEREKQGLWEVELSFRGEADLQKHYNDCKKNPGHKKFIPLLKFDRDIVPYDYQYSGLLPYIKALSDITVHVSVKYVSENRPNTCPRSGMLFPCYRNVRKQATRYGTGFITWVDRYTDQKDMKRTCPCKECLESGAPRAQFATINITTASHVVYDDLEGEHTTCHLFFDRGMKPEPSNGVVTLSGMSRVEASSVTDSCKMTHVTHDLNLADRLWKMLNDHWRFQDKLMRNTAHFSDKEKPLTVIVSHPHGCSKQVSIGYCVSRGVQANRALRYIYDTATCPGSSGALVTVLEVQSSSLTSEHLHSGSCEGSTELSHSGYEVYVGK